MSLRRATVLSLLAGLVFVSAAQSALPHPGPIVIGKSIAGVRIGMVFAQAATAWGGTGYCSPGISCRFDDNNQSTTGVASFTGKGGKVVSVVIIAPYNQAKQAYTPVGPLTKFRTAKGIRIGSTGAAVKHAYPKAKYVPGNGSLEIVSGKIRTSFSLGKGKVWAIGIQTG